MRAHAFVAASALALLAVQHAVAQTQQSSSRDSAAPVHVTIPPGGLTFNFTDIDRNGDKSISVEEWNAFVASLQSKVGRKDASGTAAAGATGTDRPAPQPQQPR